MDSMKQLALHLPSLNVENSTSRWRVLQWLQNLAGPEQALFEFPSADVLLDGFTFSRLDRLAGFWDEEGPTSLTERVSLLLTAFGRANRRVLIIVRRDGPTFSWIIGIDDIAGSLAPALGGSLPGSRVDEVSTAEVRSTLCGIHSDSKVALHGVPSRILAPRNVPLSERLASTEVDRWMLLTHASPIAGAELLKRYEHASQLRRTMSAFRSASITLSEVESREDTDPTAELATDLLKREERRSLQAARTAGFASQTWLVGGGPELAALAALTGASLTHDGGLVSRPLRILASSQKGGNPTTLLLPDELASICQPPAHDIRGFEVERWARFDMQPEPTGVDGPRLPMGRTRSGDPVSYPLDALTTHALISGTTGSGKSSLLRSALHTLQSEHPDIPFLIIEPTKDEYATLSIDGLSVWRVGDPATDPKWRLNPLEVPAGIPLQTHIDLLVALFESTFALFPPLPYILEMALRRVYERRGWDLRSGHNARAEADPDYRPFPTLRDVQRLALELVDDLGYVGEVQHNVRGALQARLGSLLEGPKGAVIDSTQPLDTDRLLGGPCLVNLDLIGNEREKAFFMGLLLIRLWEARRGQISQSLRHLTVLEEAHRIFPATPPAASSPAGGGGEFAAETLTNLLAEVRSAGEGLLVVEQSPYRLALGAITNTGIKVAFRTMGAEDREILGAAMNLNEEQKHALTSLARHEAVVFWAGMDNPIRMVADASFPPALSQGSLQKDHGVATYPIIHDPPVMRLADLLLRVSATEAPAVRQALERRVRRLMPSSLESRAEDVVGDQLAGAVERLVRDRDLSDREREQAMQRATANPPAGTVLPIESACACDGSGAATACPFLELAQTALSRWRLAQGRIPDLHTWSLADIRGEVRMWIDDIIGEPTLQIPEATRAAGACLAAQAVAEVQPRTIAHRARAGLMKIEATE